jgi:hypothetical protein
MRSRARIRARLFLFPGSPVAQSPPLKRQSGIPECNQPTRAPPSIRMQSQRPRPKPAAARLYASTAPGPGRCPGSKVRTPFEDAQRFWEVRILENPGDFFEDAHPFPRCARKSAHLRREQTKSGWQSGTWRGSAQLATVSELGAVAQSVRAADS